jgi:hypothetical protein
MIYILPPKPYVIQRPKNVILKSYSHAQDHYFLTLELKVC